jgi:hypothetical protein
MKPSAFRFVPWLLFFLLSLVSISILIGLNQFFIAKIIGFAVTITLVIVLRIWLHRLKLNAQPERILLNTNDVHELVRFMPLFSKLSPSDQKNLKHRVGLQMSLIQIENPEAIDVSEFSPRNLAMLLSCYWLFCSTATNERQHITLAKPGTHNLTSDTLQISLEEVMEKLNELNAVTIQTSLSA